MEYSLGLVEVSALGNAIIMLDDMLKAADVEFVATERKLGGRLVTIVVRGELTSVKASVDAGVARATKEIAGTHVGAIKETPVKAEKPKTVEKSTETEKTAKTTAEKKPATRRRGRPKKTQ